MSWQSMRCPTCLTNWPLVEEFEECPRCEEPTRPSSEPPLDDSEAVRQRNFALFEREYGPAEVS